MNKFWVKFKEGTSAEKITAGLKSVSASNTSFEDDTWFFSADWKTTQRDLNNLRGKIETGSGRNSVSDIGVRQDDDSESA